MGQGGGPNKKSDDQQHSHGGNDHQQGDGDGGFDIADAQFQKDGGGHHFGPHARRAGEDEDRPNLARRTGPGEGGGGEHAAAGLRQNDEPKGLAAAATQGESDLFG